MSMDLREAQDYAVELEKRIDELEKELEGKSCMTKCPNCGELASSSEINTNAYILRLEGEIVRLNKEISYLLEEIESLESKPLLFMEMKDENRT